MLGLIGNDANNAAFDFGESSNHVSCVSWHDLVKIVSVCNSFDYGEHVIWLVRIVWYNVVKDFSGTLVNTVIFSPCLVGSLIFVVGRKEIKKFSCCSNGL